MHNGKYVSVVDIIGGVYRDTGGDKELPWADMIYWVYEALSLIGVNEVLETEFSCYDMENFRVEIPCNLHSLKGVSIDGCIPIRSSDTFHELIDKESCKMVDRNASTLSASGGHYLDNFGNRFVSGAVDNTIVKDITFSINKGFIVFNQREGRVCISYYGIPTDENGYPKVPDNVRVQKAVKAYLIYKLHYIDFIKGNVNPSIFKYSESEWLFYVGSAANALRTPDEAMTETIKQSIQRLIPKQFEYKNRFENLLREKRYIQ